MSFNCCYVNNFNPVYSFGMLNPMGSFCNTNNLYGNSIFDMTIGYASNYLGFGAFGMDNLWMSQIDYTYNPFFYQPMLMPPTPNYTSNPFAVVQTPTPNTQKTGNAGYQIFKVPSPRVNKNNATNYYQQIEVSEPNISTRTSTNYQMFETPTYDNVTSGSSNYQMVRVPSSSANSNYTNSYNYTSSQGMTPKAGSFDAALVKHESRGNYKAENQWGFLGRYQMGEELLHDLGYYSNDGNLKENTWEKEYWRGKNGINSKEDFLNSPKAQDEAYQAAKKYKWKMIKHYKLDKYVGQTINGIKITKAGLLGAVYAQGIGKWDKNHPEKAKGLKPFLESGGTVNPTDGNGVPISSALRRYSGFDISDVTG